MSYSYDKFLKPITDSDVTIKILDDTDDIKYTIDPFVIINTSINNNTLKITLKFKSIVIDFSSINEAKLALIRIKEQIDILTQKVPNQIDKQTKNYINNLLSNTYMKMNRTERENLIPTIGTHVYQLDSIEGVYVYKSTGWTFAY